MRETSSSVISRLQPRERRTAKEKSTTISQEITWGTFFSKFTSPEQTSQLHCVKTRNTNNHRHRRYMEKAFDPRAAACATTGNSKKRLVITDSQFD
jgi:hypothetical protein